MEEGEVVLVMESEEMMMESGAVKGMRESEMWEEMEAVDPEGYYTFYTHI